MIMSGQARSGIQRIRSLFAVFSLLFMNDAPEYLGSEHKTKERNGTLSQQAQKSSQTLLQLQKKNKKQTSILHF